MSPRIGFRLGAMPQNVSMSKSKIRSASALADLADHALWALPLGLTVATDLPCCIQHSDLSDESRLQCRTTQLYPRDAPENEDCHTGRW